ncbi:MAG: hypothetical protein COA78_01290 [Blastopirellula sp.]|nr:MAG: hypothetical protein COA78_01290 [Blastopirellula sp.]
MNAKLATILLLLALVLSPPLAYAGGYYANVRRTTLFACGPTTCGSSIAFVEYRYGGQWSVSVFAPAHEVDKVIRPWYWKE